MTGDAVDTIALLVNFCLASLLVVVLLSWIVSRHKNTGNWFFRRFVWPIVVAELIFIPLILYGLGQFVAQAFIATGNTELAEIAHNVFILVVLLSIAIGIGRGIEVWAVTSNPDDTERYFRLPQLVRIMHYALCLFVGLIVYFTINGYRPTELYLSTGAFAAVLAFAMQQTLGDFFSGIALSIERPFRLGEWIVLDDGREGEIVDINWRSTRLRGWDNATHVIPNSMLARNAFKNMHGNKHQFAPWYEVKISADIDPQAINVILLEAALRCHRVLKNPLPLVRLMNATSAPYTYMVWVHYPSYPAMFAGREELFREIHNGLKQAGLQVATDIQEIRHKRADTVQLEPPNVVMALKSIDFGSALSDAELQQIAEMSQRVFYDAGAVIVNEGELSDSFYIVASGVVDASINVDGNKKQHIERLNPGEYFGIVSMLTSEESMMQFTASTGVSVIRIDVGNLRSVVTLSDDLSEKFAQIVQRRRRRVEEVRVSVDASFAPLTFNDFVRKVENSLRRPSSSKRRTRRAP